MKFFADVHCYHMISPIVSGEPLNLHPVAPPRGGSAVATITDCKESQNEVLKYKSVCARLPPGDEPW